MSIINTNPQRVDVSRGLRELLMRNGIQARVAFSNDGKPILIVKGHDSPEIEYKISDRQLNDLMQWSDSYRSVNRTAYNTFVNIVKNDFHCPATFVYAANAFSPVATGLHGYRIGVGEYGNNPRWYGGFGGWRNHLYGGMYGSLWRGGFRPALLWGGGGPFHGRMIGGRYFANYTQPWVSERPDGRLKPGEMQSGGYGFYWKGNLQKREEEVEVKDIRPVELQPMPRNKHVIPFYSPSAWSKSHWNDVLDSHGIVVDEKKGTITIQSKALRADVVFTEKDDPDIRKKIKAIMCDKLAAEPKKGTFKGVKASDKKTSYSVTDRVFLINEIIDSKFKDKVTKDMLFSNEMINIEAKPECKAEIEKDYIVQDQRKAAKLQSELVQNQRQYAEDLLKQDIDVMRARIYNDPNAVNGREIAAVLGEKGWFVNRSHGRELNVGEIRVDKVGDKFYMSADVNGEVMQKEISAKAYGKFLNYDDAHRLNMFASTFDEVKIDDAAIKGGRSVYDYGNESAFSNKMPISYEDRLSVIQGYGVDAQAIADYASSMGVAVNTEAFQIGVNPNPEVYQTEVLKADAEKMKIIKGNNYDPYNGGMTVQQRLDYINSLTGGNRLTMEGLTKFAIENRDEIFRRNVSIGRIDVNDMPLDGKLGVKPAVVENITEEEINRGEISFEPKKPASSREIITDGAAEYFNSNGMIQRMFIQGGNKPQVEIQKVCVSQRPDGSYMLYADVNGIQERRPISQEKAEKFAHSDNMGKMKIACDTLNLEIAERSKVCSDALKDLNKGHYIVDGDGKHVGEINSITAEKNNEGNYVLKVVTKGEDGQNNTETFQLSKNEYRNFSQGDTSEKMSVLHSVSGGKFNYDGTIHNENLSIEEKKELNEGDLQRLVNDQKNEYKAYVGDAEVKIYFKDHFISVSMDGNEYHNTLSNKDFNRFLKGNEEQKKAVLAKYFPGDFDLTRLNPSDVYKLGGVGKDSTVSFRKNGKDYIVQANIGDDVFVKGINSKEYEQFKVADTKGKAALMDKWMAGSTEWNTISDGVSTEKDNGIGKGRNAGVAASEKRDEKKSIWEGRLSDSVDGNSLKDVNHKKGWFREGEGGREVSVGEIRVEKIDSNDKDGKYSMSAVINGEVVRHEISQKQYDKFLAMDDGGRMKLFSKIFPEVDMKTLPQHKFNLGAAILAGLVGVAEVAHDIAHIGILPPPHRHHHNNGAIISVEGYYKPGVGDGRVVVVRDAAAMAAGNFNDADGRMRDDQREIDNAKGRGV